MTTAQLMIPDVGQLQQDSEPLVAEARSMAVVDAPTYERAGTLFRELGGRLRVIEAFFKPIKQSLDQHKRTILDRERLVSEPIDTARRHCNGQMVTWSVEQERQRQIAEKQAKDDAKIAEAEHHERLGDHHAADEALDGRGMVDVSIPDARPVVAGVSQRETYVAEITDLLVLVKAIATGHAPLEAVLPNMVFLNREARARRGELAFPGVVPIRKVGMAG